MAGCGRASASPGESARVNLESLPSGNATYDANRSEMVLEIPPIDIPAAMPGHDGMIVTPATRVVVPVGGFVHSAYVEVVDPEGNRLPASRLHHFNVIDPGRRELFGPVALRLFAASKETGDAKVPQLLFGVPLIAGQQLVLKAMLHNTESQPVRGARARVVFGFAKGGLGWPVFQVFPTQLDVLFPVGGPDGEKSFDLPPGRSEHHHEASPAVPGTLVGLGGHVHDYAQFLEFRDLTDNRVIWRGVPYEDEDGTVTSMPSELFYRWHRLGIHIEPSHTYQVRVVYDNPTGDTIKYGGMGAVGGLFAPDRASQWPTIDTTDAAYRRDLFNQLRDGNSVGEMRMMNDHHAHHAAAQGPPAKPAEPMQHQHGGGPHHEH
jgi:hypothetical protein